MGEKVEEEEEEVADKVSPHRHYSCGGGEKSWEQTMGSVWITRNRRDDSDSCMTVVMQYLLLGLVWREEEKKEGG